MSDIGNKSLIAVRLLQGVSAAALLIAGAASLRAAELSGTYSPAANNGGGASPGRSDIITLNATTDTITGDYNLIGTSARRFEFDSASIEMRNSRGEVISGYGDVADRAFLALGNDQKTLAVTYPDLIQGTNRSTLAYDNDQLGEIAATSSKTLTVRDTGAPVYGDLRLADIAGSTVTIATGDKAKSIYDPANFAILTADSGSTLYDVSGGSTVRYDSRTATMDGADQDGLSQAATTTVTVPVTSYSGIGFNGGDSVTDLASLKRYNSYLIGQLTSGAITPAQYENSVQAAARTTDKLVTVRTTEIPPYSAPPTTSDRIFIKLDRSTLITTAGSQLVGVTVAEGNSDGISTLISARNGSTVVNNGIIAQGEGGPGIRLFDAGTSLTNSATGVIGVGYETLDRSTGTPVPTGISDYRGEGFANQAIRASDGARVDNRGIVNVGNLDIPDHPENPAFGKANAGIVTLSGASSVNSGTILIGGADSAAAITRGLFEGAAGMVAYDGGTAVNAASGTIRVGTSFAENAADLSALRDVVSTNYASGMASLGGGGSIVNNGLIRIGSLAQNATGMMVRGDGNTAVNNGTITIDGSALSTPSARNAAIWARGGSVAGADNAVNASTGTIRVSGVNSVGLLVGNEVSGGSARATNNGSIIVDGGLSADRLRNYGVFVGNASSSAMQNGSVVLTGADAIGVHARNGGTIDVGASGTLDFRAGNQIGYYTLGAGSRINLNAAATTDVDTTGSTGFRAEGGARIGGASLSLIVSGDNAVGIVGTGASTGTTIDAGGSRLSITGTGATGIIIEGGATGRLDPSSRLDLVGRGAIAAIVDGQGHDLSGANAGAPIATTSLQSSANLTSASNELTGYIARNQASLAHSGNILFGGSLGTGILATTGATVTNSGNIAIGAGATGIRLVSLGAADVVTGNNSGALTANDGGVGRRTRAIQADGAGARANLLGGTVVTLNGTGAIGADAINGGTIALSPGVRPVFSTTAADQIAFHVAGAGAAIIGAPATADASGIRSTLFRFDDGATARFDASTLSASGAGSAAIVAAGQGTSVASEGSNFLISGAGASGLIVYGGASATLDAASRIDISGTGYGAIVDGQSSLLDTSFGPASAASLVTSASIGGSGPGAVGLQISGATATATNEGAVDLSGIGATGARVIGGGALINEDNIRVASGTGVVVDGSGSRLTGNAGFISADDGIAAARLANGGTIATSGSFAAAGTAHAILVDTGAGALSLSNGRIAVAGSGNGIENAGNSSAILLQNERIEVSGSGSGIRTAVSIDPASSATILASGSGSTGLTFADIANAPATGNLTLGSGLSITASGVGATGVRLNTSGNVMLATTVSVTGPAGGSALVGGPASSIMNSGSLISASSAAPVVDLTGGTIAFTNQGVISAPSVSGVAIQGGGNGQSVTLAGGAVTGAVALGSGADTFLMTGGTLAGAFDAGAGNDSATFRGLGDSNLSAVSRIAGGGSTGGDVLTFDATQSTGTRRLAGWDVINLINGSALTADGDLSVTRLLAIDRSSTLYAGDGANVTIGSPSGTIPTVNNAGIIDLTNGRKIEDHLTVRGNYVGQGGTLKLDTLAGPQGPTADRLVIDGGMASGSTAIQIVSLDGLGAMTAGDGIEVVGAINGATTTARTTRSAFTLAGTHIDVGAYEYRLYASNLSGTNESWYLRSQSQPDPGEVAVPTYRSEVPLLGALPNRLRQDDLSMLGTYHKRMGDQLRDENGNMTTSRRLWGRAIADDIGFRQGGDAQPATNGHVYGFQIGVDIARVGTANGGLHEIGVYGGHIGGSTTIYGFSGGLADQYAGKLDPRTNYAGLYWTYSGPKGFYVDTVVQRSWYDGNARSAAGNSIGINGTGALASIEAGYGIALSTHWTLEPQAQIIAQTTSLDDIAIPNARVSQHSAAHLTGRLGLRLKGQVGVGTGSVQPYLRANIWKGFASTDRARFSTAAASDVIRTPASSLSGEGGAGLSWSLTSKLTIYGEADHRFTLDHKAGVTGHSTSGSIGMKVAF